MKQTHFCAGLAGRDTADVGLGGHLAAASASQRVLAEEEGRGGGEGGREVCDRLVAWGACELVDALLAFM